MVLPAIAPIGPVQRHGRATQACGLKRPRAKKTERTERRATLEQTGGFAKRAGWGARAPKKPSEPSEEQRSSRRGGSRSVRVGAPARQKNRANRAKSNARADGWLSLARPQRFTR